MADITQKLIYAATLAKFQEVCSDWNKSTSKVYRSVVYTGDGYIVTHGVVIKGSIVGGSGSVTGEITDGKLYLTDSAGNKSEGIQLPVYAISSLNDGVTVTEDSTGVFKVGLTDVTVDTTANTENNGTITVSKVTADNKGRVTAINDKQITLDKVKVETGGTTGSLLVGETGTNYLKQSNVTVNGSAISVSDITLNNVSLSSTLSTINDNISANNTDIKANATSITNLTNTVSSNKTAIENDLSTHKSTYGTDSVKGHVSVTDTISGVNDGDDTNKSSTSVVASPYAVQKLAKEVLAEAKSAAQEYANSLAAANDAMVFAGIIDTSAKVTAVASTTGISVGNVITSSDFKSIAKTGWTFKVGGEGRGSSAVIDGEILEPGDMVIFDGDNWNVIQSNIDNPVEIASDLSSGTLVLGAGTNTIKSLANGSEGTVLRMGSNGIEWGKDTPNRAITVNGNSFIAANSTDTFNIAAGDNVELTTAGQTVTIKATDTTYNSGIGITIGSDNKLNLQAATSSVLGGIKSTANSGFKKGVTVDSAGNATVDVTGLVTGGTGITISNDSAGSFVAKLASANSNTGTFGTNSVTGSTTTIVVPSFTVDEYGRVTAASDKTISITDTQFSAGEGLSLSGTTFSLNKATDTTLGGFKTGYTTSSSAKNYAVRLDSSTNQAYVNVPWTDTTYSISTSTSYDTSTKTATINIGGTNFTNQTVNIVGTGAATINRTTDGTIVVDALNTWRPVTAYKANVSSTMLNNESIAANTLSFGSSLCYDNGSIEICWAEIDANGAITYA